MMKRCTSAFAVLMLATPIAFAYQVTGPVVDVTDSKIVVEKNKENWEIARDKDTKVTGDLKKGARVTVQYRMTATTIEAKDTTKGKDTKAKDSKGKDTAASDSKSDKK